MELGFSHWDDLPVHASETPFANAIRASRTRRLHQQAGYEAATSVEISCCQYLLSGARPYKETPTFAIAMKKIVLDNDGKNHQYDGFYHH